MYFLIEDLEFIQCYLDDFLILSNRLCNNHLHKVEMILQCLHKVELKVCAKKEKFTRPELEYLGYLITHKVIKPVPKKTKAIIEIKVPKNS